MIFAQCLNFMSTYHLYTPIQHSNLGFQQAEGPSRGLHRALWNIKYREVPMTALLSNCYKLCRPPLIPGNTDFTFQHYTGYRSGELFAAPLRQQQLCVCVQTIWCGDVVTEPLLSRLVTTLFIVSTWTQPHGKYQHLNITITIYIDMLANF